MSTTLSPKIDHALSPGRAKTRGHLGLWRLLITEMPFPRSKALGERVDVGPRVGSAGCLRGDQAGGMNALRIELEALTRAERRDLANALLRAAWTATLGETRILLLDLMVALDESALAEDAG
jgi:hypothetical protein